MIKIQTTDGIKVEADTVDDAMAMLERMRAIKAQQDAAPTTFPDPPVESAPEPRRGIMVPVVPVVRPGRGPEEVERRAAEVLRARRALPTGDPGPGMLNGGAKRSLSGQTGVRVLSMLYYARTTLTTGGILSRLGLSPTARRGGMAAVSASMNALARHVGMEPRQVFRKTDYKAGKATRWGLTEDGRLVYEALI